VTKVYWKQFAMLALQLGFDTEEIRKLFGHTRLSSPQHLPEGWQPAAATSCIRQVAKLCMSDEIMLPDYRLIFSAPWSLFCAVETTV
jgi:hypothetical protein